MWTTRPGSLNRRPRKNRSLIRLKIAVFSPIPSASVINARKVNPGDLSNCRTVKRKSVIMMPAFGILVTKRDHRIHFHGAARGNVAGEQGSGSEERNHDCVNRSVVRTHAVKQRRHHSSGAERD